MKTSIKGLIEIAREEGLVRAPYLDAVGVWTFGIGHAATSGLDPDPSKMARGMPADLDAAIALSFKLFRDHLGVFERGVLRAITVTMTQSQFDACVSLCFNIGAGGFGKSSVARHMNAGNPSKAANSFLLWNKGRVNGKLVRIEGLANRRDREKRIFETGRYPGGTIPVMAVSATNKPRYGTVVRHLTEAQVTAYLQPSVSRSTARPAPVVVQNHSKSERQGWLARILELLASLIKGKRT